MRNGGEMDDVSIMRVAGALRVSTQELLGLKVVGAASDQGTPPHPPRTPIESDNGRPSSVTARVKIYIDADFDSFDDTKVQSLVAEVRKVTGYEGDVVVIAMKRGSVIIELGMSDEAANKLADAYREKRLEALAITAIEVEPIADVAILPNRTAIPPRRRFVLTWLGSTAALFVARTFGALAKAIGDFIKSQLVITGRNVGDFICGKRTKSTKRFAYAYIAINSLLILLPALGLYFNVINNLSWVTDYLFEYVMTAEGEVRTVNKVAIGIISIDISILIMSLRISWNE